MFDNLVEDIKVLSTKLLLILYLKKLNYNSTIINSILKNFISNNLN